MRPARVAPSGLGGFPKPGPVLTAILIALPVAYLVELLVARSIFPGIFELLALSPPSVMEGRIWQPITYVFVHNPGGPGHLFFNLLGFYFLGAPLERWWGSRRFGLSCLVFLLAGGATTVLFALVVGAMGIDGWFMFLPVGPHLGADAIVVGLSVAFGIVSWSSPMQLLLVPVTFTGRTWVLVTLAIEVFSALSFSGISSTSHFGAIAASVLLCTGAWRLDTLRDLLRRKSLRWKMRSIEKQLEVIDGGRSNKKKDDLPN
ncbi:MAG: rhomboid family intramembrane serine protease [Deltaproteobacteria bacterium]|nr:rhomboid family intramembrane serine protease [Deltaproteobacteria bacterium]